MSEIEKQLRAALGTAGFWLLIKALRKVEVSFDAEEKNLILYAEKHDPVVIGFDVIEDFVNNVH